MPLPYPAHEPPEVCATSDDWHHRVRGLIEALPWFGQDVTAVTRSRRRRSERLNTEDHWRVLLSWLAGGSVTQIARRAAVSRRTVYAVLTGLFYVYDAAKAMPYWHDLGLIECLVTPSCREVDGSVWQEVVCLICHRNVATYDWCPQRLMVSEVFRPDPKRHIGATSNTRETTQRTQGHLIFHFWLEPDPVRSRGWFYDASNERAWAAVPRRALDYVAEFRTATSACCNTSRSA